MTELVETIHLPDLTPVGPGEEGVAEGSPRLVFTWAFPAGPASVPVTSYTPSDGGAPRLVASIGLDDGSPCVGVWDTSTGAFLQAVRDPDLVDKFTCIVSYQRRPDGGYAVAAGHSGGYICIWNGDNFQRLRTLDTDPTARRAVPVRCLLAYEEPTNKQVRLISG
jgi:WD40 repeat protein